MGRSFGSAGSAISERISVGRVKILQDMMKAMVLVGLDAECVVIGKDREKDLSWGGRKCLCRKRLEIFASDGQSKWRKERCVRHFDSSPHVLYRDVLQTLSNDTKPWYE